MLVRAPYIAEASLRNPRPLIARPYTTPFLPAYAYFYKQYLERYDEYFGSHQWVVLYFGAIVSVQLLVWLMTFWSADIKEVFETTSASSPATAQLIKVVPKRSHGATEIVKLRHEDPLSFSFQQRRFIWNAQDKVFEPPQFWVDQPVRIAKLVESSGLSTKQADAEFHEYGQNTFDIPVPTFVELWKEHAVQPFFVFQLFSIALWLLDDMWKSSIFSLFTLVSFESTVVYQRQRTMTEFRSMGIKPYDIWVLRNRKWTQISTTKVVPGDLISVNRSPEDSGLPCDLILVSGTAVVNEAMLSGESTPLLKESVSDRSVEAELDLEGVDRNSLLSGGTKALQVTPGSLKNIPSPPDSGALAVVARTGFETSQGQLVRTMIFSSEKVGAGNKEAYFFILGLLVFAVAASYYVWIHGQEVDRPRSKLLLDCVLIITSVVPPELPMELTLAVNSSLAALSKFYVYCTEPFRIPYAGRIDVCCFDKTGTLTEEDLTVEGMVDASNLQKMISVKDLSPVAAQTLASAHALVLLEDGEVVGDPLEQTTLKSLGWSLGKNDEVTSDKQKIKIVKRFQFSSALKRQSSLAKLAGSGDMFVAVKGAPETIQKMLKKVPAGYEEAFTHYTREGSRVLAYARKQIDRHQDIQKYSRESAEAPNSLEFVGFLVFHSPLKEDAISTVKMLGDASHRVVMITGDNPLTAVKVAQDVNIVSRHGAVLEVLDGKLVWLLPDDSKKDFDPENPVGLFEEYDLCLTGPALSLLETHKKLAQIVCHTWVWARVSPAQKELILTTLKHSGYMTLMCGDGTNDVGALKQAHLGVALLNATEGGMKKIQDQQRIDQMRGVYEKQCAMMARWNAPPPPVPAPIAHLYPPGPRNPHYANTVRARGGTIDAETQRKIDQSRTEPNAVAASQIADKVSGLMDEGEDEAPTLKLGDASCAAPLTSKLRNVSAVTHVIRQGRCTLVATIQMYKILALNCLISAYTLSVLFLAGIKIGDAQSVAAGLLISMCYMSISRARAVDTLSKERPQPGIFNIYICGSVLLQFAVHIATLIYVRSWVYSIELPVKVDLEAKFEPSLLNTAMFLLQNVQEISTFAVNYQGKPFRESLTQNRGMYYGIIGCLGLSFAGATELFPELNEALSLVPMSTSFKTRLTSIMLLDLGACFAIEHTLKHFFSDYKAADIAQPVHMRKVKVLQK